MNTTIPRDTLKDWDILVVEDEVDSLEVAERILKFYGARVHSATNGQQGLDMLITQSLHPRFIICDLSMPVMSGWEFVDQLKRNRATLDIPVIALTAHAMIGDREKAIAAGFHNYLTKPLTAKTFMTDLLRVLTDIPLFMDELSK